MIVSYEERQSRQVNYGLYYHCNWVNQVAVQLEVQIVPSTI